MNANLVVIAVTADDEGAPILNLDGDIFCSQQKSRFDLATIFERALGKMFGTQPEVSNVSLPLGIQLIREDRIDDAVVVVVDRLPRLVEAFDVPWAPLRTG